MTTTTHINNIKLKSLKQPASPDDGLRIMIARYPLRYQKVKDRDWEWWKDLAPSKQLHRDYIILKNISWEQYVPRYLSEIEANPKAQELLRKLKALVRDGKTVTLLCHCSDETHCHRKLVKQLCISF
jgi:uncharacterized protein YeaO (DUF488 family)